VKNESLESFGWGDESDQDDIVWNYYPQTDLMAYCVGYVGKTHPQVEIAVTDKLGDQEETILSGELYIRRRKIPMSISVCSDEAEIPAETKGRLIRGFQELIRNEEISADGANVNFFSSNSDSRYDKEYTLAELLDMD